MSVTVGDRVSVWVVSDVDAEIHVHGYDVFFEAPAGVPTKVALTADVPGIFEVEIGRSPHPPVCTRGHSLTRRLGVVSTLIAGVVLGLPSVAMAHGIGGRLDLPVPLSYFIVGAGVVLVITFIGLAVLWPEPRLQEGPRHKAARLTVGRGLATCPPPGGDRPRSFVIGQLIPPLFGLETDPTRPTIAPVLVWVLFWLVVPFAGAVIGDWYTDINPWRSLARVLRLGRGERTGHLDALGVWPAAIVLVAFTWLELVSPDSGDPVTLGAAALVYTLGMLAAVPGYAGRETGLAVVDGFTPYNRLLSAISPVGRRGDGRLVWRGLAACSHRPSCPGGGYPPS